MDNPWNILQLVLWLIVVLQSLLLVAVLRNLGILHETVTTGVRSQGPPSKLAAGDKLPSTDFVTLEGRTQSVSGYIGRRIAFSIVSTTCGPCIQLLKAIGNNEVDPDPLDPTLSERVIVFVGATVQDSASVVQRTGVTEHSVVVDTHNSVFSAWGIQGTPVTVIVDEQLRVVRQVFAA